MQDALAKDLDLIERFALDSSSIKSAGYGEGHLVVEFSSGDLFAYAMEHREFLKFAEAESKGKYFASAIKGRFPGTKLTGKCATCLGIGIIGQACTATAGCGGPVRAVDRVHKEAK